MNIERRFFVLVTSFAALCHSQIEQQDRISTHAVDTIVVAFNLLLPMRNISACLALKQKCCILFSHMDNVIDDEQIWKWL